MVEELINEASNKMTAAIEQKNCTSGTYNAQNRK